MASPKRMEIDTNAAPEQTTNWADAVDAPGNGRRCWADESECLSPEFAPISFLSGGNSTKNNGFKRLDSGNRFFPADDDTPQYSLDELHPPFNAFVGGLSFHIDEQDLANFFSGRNCKVSCVRLPREDPKKGKGTRSKGFGYVEFVDARSLRTALQQNGTMFQDRKIKVDIADRDDRPASTKKGSGGRRKGERERDPWLKDPPRSQKSSGKGSSQVKSGRGQGGNDWYGDQNATWQQTSRSGRGGGATERYEPMGASAGAGGYGDSRGLGYIAAGSSGGFGAGTRGNVFGNGAGATASSPAERVPLKLVSKKDASQDGSPSPPSAPSEAPKKKVDPFGGAKPRDEFEYERRHAAEEAAKKAQATVPPVPAPQEAAPIHSPQFQPQSQPPPPPQHHPQQQQQSQQLQSQSLSAKDKKKQDNGQSKQLQAQSQPLAPVKEKKKQEIVEESYTSGWDTNDWDWSGGGWSETRSTSRPKGGGSVSRGGKGKKGKGRGGKRSGLVGGNADQDANWRS